MMNLQNARVLLVDDTPEESLPVIKAFAKNGISVAYFDGTMESLPQDGHRLRGVRLALLDMDLTGGGVDEKSKISTLIAVLGAILASDNGPYTMIAWTKHSELIDLLEDSLFRLYIDAEHKPTVPLPLVCVRLEKKDFRTDTGVFDVDRLATTIQAELSQLSSWNIMQAWETRCLQAGIALTNSVSDLVSTSGDTLSEWRDTWNTDYLRILVSLAKEEIGEGNLSTYTFAEALFGALYPLLVDLLETNSLTLPDLPEVIEELAQARVANPSAGTINTRIHLSFENLDRFRPGTVYRLEHCDGIFPINARGIFDDLRQPDIREDVIEELFPKVIPVVVDVSASCDFAQRKVKLAKFVAGLLIPINEGKRFKQALGNLLATPQFHIESEDKLLLLSSQHMTTAFIENFDHLSGFFRLRSQMLAYIQFWLAQQLSRPGIMSLR